MATRREKEKRQRRYADAVSRAEKQETGGGPSAFKVPKGMSLFRFDEAGLFKLRILPYTVSERAIDHRFADPGFDHYEYSYWVHAGIGLDGASKHCCLRECFKKKCPVCDYLASLDRWGMDKDLYNSLRPKQRQLFAILNLDDKDKGVQILETSFFSGPGQISLGQTIDNKVRANREKYGGFFHAEDGMALHITTKQGKAFKGKPTWNISDVEWVEAKDLDEEILDQVPSLDELPIELGYDELEELFTQKGQAKSDKPTEAPSRNGSKQRDEEEDEDDEPKKATEHDYEAGDRVIYEGDEWKVKRVAQDGTLVLENEDGDTVRNIDASECSPPAKKKSKPVKPSRKQQKEEDEDLDSDLEDEEDYDSDTDESDEDDLNDTSDLEDDEDEPPARGKGRVSRR